MISNQTVINIAIATNIAARAIHNTKATRICHNKTNKFRYNPIVKNRYNRIKHNILRKHLKSNQNMTKFIAINIYLGETNNGEKKYGNIMINPNYIEQFYIKEYEEKYVTEYESDYGYTTLEELKENQYIMKYLDKEYEITKDSYDKLYKILVEGLSII